MRIDNSRLLANVAEILDSSGYFMNEETGEIRQGDAFTSLINTLRDYKYRWRNVSNLSEGDFEDSGFETLHQGNYFNGPKSPWVSIHSEYKTGKITKGRRVAKGSWIIISKKSFDYAELEAAWVVKAQELQARHELFLEAYNAARAVAEADGKNSIECS